MSKLEEILQQEADAEINAMLAEADSRAREIVSQAESRAAALLAAHGRRIEARERAASQQARSASELSISSARIQAKGEVMDLLRQKVLLALEKTSSQGNYGEVLQALAEQAMRGVEVAETVVVHPDDKPKLGSWALAKGLELQTDSELRLGVRIVNRRGTKVENTLPERLHRAWSKLAPGVTKLLWE
jgi:V/A-type H+/Na+-transporting ATPase subunit E